MKETKTKDILFYSSVVIGLLQPAVTHAGGGEMIQFGVMDWVWKIVNFAILVFLLVKFVKKPLQNYLEQRRETLQKTFNEAKEAKEMAQKALKEVEDRLVVKDKEIADILETAKESGEREKARLIEEGERMKQRILEQAKINIDYEVRKAKEAIQNEAAEAALMRAEQMIKEGITETDQERLFRESLKLLEGKN